MSATRHEPERPRDRIRRLQQEGGTCRSIAAAAGLAPAAVHDLVAGRRQPAPSTTRALQNASGRTLIRAHAGAGGTRLRLRPCTSRATARARIARAPGVRETTIRRLVRGDATAIGVTLRDAVSDLYQAWRDKSAPERPDAVRGTLRNRNPLPAKSHGRGTGVRRPRRSAGQGVWPRAGTGGGDMTADQWPYVVTGRSSAVGYVTLTEYLESDFPDAHLDLAAEAGQEITFAPPIAAEAGQEAGHVDPAAAIWWHQAQTETVGLNRALARNPVAERALPDRLGDWMEIRVAELEQAEAGQAEAEL